MRPFHALIALLTPFFLSTAVVATEAAPRELTVADTGFAARYYAPPAGVAARSAVVMVGGSGGGYPPRRAAADLAEAGHPVLALAYFSGFEGKIEGVPARLERIPLEYIYGAIDWLRDTIGPDVSVAVMGESRGAELALLVGSRRDDLAGVIAFSPTSVVWPAVGDMTGRVPAWTEAGQPVPYLDRPVADPARQFTAGLADAARSRHAAIPVERTKAAVLLISSRSDGIWPAAQMADQLVARARAAGRPPRIESLQFDDASHLLMGPGPGVVRFTQGTFTVYFGGSETGTLRAREQAWDAAKRFLAALPAEQRNRSGTPPKSGGR